MAIHATVVRRLGLAEIGMLCLLARGYVTSPQNGLTATTGLRLQNNKGQTALTALRRCGFVEAIPVTGEWRADKYVKNRWRVSSKGLNAWQGAEEADRRAGRAWARSLFAENRQRNRHWPRRVNEPQQSIAA